MPDTPTPGQVARDAYWGVLGPQYHPCTPHDWAQLSPACQAAWEAAAQAAAHAGEAPLMGNVGTITATRFPQQGRQLGRRCHVCFHYDTAHLVPGVIVRDDAEPPFVLLIRLEDGRTVLAEECQYILDREADAHAVLDHAAFPPLDLRLEEDSRGSQT